ncbi:hypothetical protein M0R19_00220 [Candidatus Pacearchaeota archaeon]|nr:hypothetical protein [Candidatus Pacearchaeota archaeon]
MKKKVGGILISLIFIFVLLFFIFQKTSFVVGAIDSSQLENITSLFQNF